MGAATTAPMDRFRCSIRFLDFAAGVGNVPLIYHVPEDGHNIKSIGGVQIVIGGDKADVVLIKGALQQANL